MVNTKKEASGFHRSASLCLGVEGNYGFGCACGCVLALCFLLWMFFDAPFCSLLICFFLGSRQRPAIGLAVAATCLLMPFC